MQRLENKIVLVTGEAWEIGKTIAELFAKLDARVIVSTINDKQDQEVANRIGEKSIYIRFDVGEEKDWIAVSEFIRDDMGDYLLL